MGSSLEDDLIVCFKKFDELSLYSYYQFFGKP